MTIAESYREYTRGKINKAQFMERARKDHHLKGLVTNVMTFQDTVRVLKNKGIISEAKTQAEIIPAEIRKGVNYELGLTFQAIPDWDDSFVTPDQMRKVEAKVLKNLQKDSLYYTKLIATGQKPKGDEPESEIEYKESTVSDTTNKTKADGHLKKEVKKDEDSNVQTSLSKSEKKTGKPEGVTQLKEAADFTFNGYFKGDELNKLKELIDDAEIDVEETGEGTKTTVTSHKYPEKNIQHAVNQVMGNLEPAADKRDLGKYNLSKLKEAIRKHVEEAIRYSIGSTGTDSEYRKTDDPDLENKLRKAGVSFTKKKIS